MKLAFLFRTAPHGNAISREGLDALLAATAFCDEEEIGVFFIDDGVLLAVKYGEMFTQCKGQYFVLEQDVLARNLTALLPENNKVRSISLADLVDLTAQYSPQIAL